MKREIRKMTNQYMKTVLTLRSLGDEIMNVGAGEYDDLADELECMDEHLYICYKILEECLKKY